LEVGAGRVYRPRARAVRAFEAARERQVELYAKVIKGL